DAPALQRLLDDTAARDHLIVPVGVADVLAGDAWVAADAQGVPVGVGWRRDGAAAVVDVRVHPRHRRKGIGDALLKHLLARHPGGPVVASCDAGHARAQHFVRHRGFTLKGVVFFQRWDGELEDVPRAFKNARVAVGADAAADWALLQAAAADTWPPPTVTAEDLADPAVRTRVAWVGDTPAGVVVATREADAWVAGGFAVLPACRKRGVGRQLLSDLMAEAAREGLGVVLRVSHEAEQIQAWTAALGFWTYRSWCYWVLDPAGMAAAG
ncbi:MAG: GNAT family N-acetyltransferase, partial [Myxococcales bacterium]|nr:GNAT family N-acetyltransferase [Myxococcales bacterium]